MKLKRTPLFWIFVIMYIVPLILPRSEFIIWIVLMLGGLYLLPVIATSYIFSREYQESTISQLFTYPQARKQVYVAKMGVIITFFIGTLFYVYMKGGIKVGDIYATLVYIFLVPLIVLVGILIQNFIVSVIVQVGLGWFIHGQVERFVNIYCNSSPYYDTRIPLCNFGLVKIKNILSGYLWGTSANITFTMVVVCLSFVSTCVGMYLFSNRDILR